ncbi:MAG: hypothetical protein KF802_07180 [Bdellovibrionaceae bacterium]|nr:hypothetical protein [Pseudobdellovibrionaceae bacterium]
MKRHRDKYFPLLLLILASMFALSACVSVSLPKSQGKKASDVVFAAPPSPFRALPAPQADQAWVNDGTGNTISFMSDCAGKADPSLEQLQAESLNAMSQLKVLSDERRPYNARLAAVSLAEGEVDGIAVKMKVLTLKKNDCNYTLSYTGVRAGFDRDLAAFERFVQGFKAP